MIDVQAMELSLSENEMSAICALGERLVGEGRYADAAKAFELLLAFEPTDAYFNRAHGVCCERAGLLDEARPSLDRALEANGNDVYARVARAAVALRRGELDQARSDLAAAQRSPDRPSEAISQRIQTLAARLAG